MLSFLKGSRDDSGGARWLDRLKQGLDKTRKELGVRLAGLFASGRALDESLYEELEAALLMADVGPTASAALLRAVRERARREGYAEAGQLRHALQAALLDALKPLAVPLDVDAHRPFVIMLAGVVLVSLVIIMIMKRMSPEVVKQV